jgi:hypothetical protein
MAVSIAAEVSLVDPHGSCGAFGDTNNVRRPLVSPAPISVAAA